ncbi:hypothetical protein [Vibrio owensii]|uniref:hypothetical protein n=1 Tax=Vibrio owensii TaxID=696485 RepID=UPI003CC64FF7
MTEREQLIQQLTNAINKREGVELTTEQVNHYIGCDMPVSKLAVWTHDTENGNDPVTSNDVLSLWEE